MIVDLGCGQNKKSNATIGVDKRNYDCVDIVCNIENGLPFATESVSIIYAISVLEHITYFPYIMNEIHRVLKPHGYVAGKVPHYTDSQAYTDPTHKHLFTTHTFDYWDSSTTYGSMGYFNREFSIEKCKRVRRIQFWKSRPIIFRLQKQ